LAGGSKLRITTNAVTSMRKGLLGMEEFLGLVVSKNVIVAGGLQQSNDWKFKGPVFLEPFSFAEKLDNRIRGARISIFLYHYGGWDRGGTASDGAIVK
jgi:hypothetical protein